MKQKRYYEYTNSLNKFCYDLEKEIDAAKTKFPGGDKLLGALMEEVGEVAEALLKIEESNESPQNVYNEAIQVAAVAYRLATEGEPDYGYEGVKCNYQGCSQVCIGGPCALCYE